jgi:hypothetical protein
MAKARIRERVKSSMQSGRALEGAWILEYDVPHANRADPLTGWAGSGDTQGQVRIGFPTLDAAKAYADKHGLSYEISGGGKDRPLRLQAYADNFKGPDLSF